MKTQVSVGLNQPADTADKKVTINIVAHTSKRIGLFFKDFKIPTSGGKVIRRGWYGLNPSSWGAWYEHCEKIKKVLDKTEATLYITNIPQTTENKMRIHENTSFGRSESTCGYCRQKGHNQYSCPHVKNFFYFFSIL